MDIIDIIEESKSLKAEMKIIKQILSELEQNDSELPLEVGSRVLIKWANSKEGLGRIVGIRNGDGAFLVHRDGYAGVIGLGISHPSLTEHTLENISNGPYGKLDKKLWLIERRILKLNNIISKMVGSDISLLTHFK